MVSADKNYEILRKVVKSERIKGRKYVDRLGRVGIWDGCDELQCLHKRQRRKCFECKKSAATANSGIKIKVKEEVSKNSKIKIISSSNVRVASATIVKTKKSSK